MRHDVVIVGAGVSGLATAYWLRRERPGLDVVVLEAGEEPGGHVVSSVVDGFTVDRGPSSLRRGAAHADELIGELGLEADVIQASPSASRRYLVLAGSLVAVPASPRAVLATPLLSPVGKTRALMEPLIPRGQEPEESVAGFLRRRFGPRVATTIAEALVSGLVAGDPERLSLRALFPQLAALEERHRSVLRGLLASKAPPAPRGLYTFRGGLGRLTAALASALGPTLRPRTAVTGIRRGTQGYVLELSGGARLTARSIVLATPAHVAAGLLGVVAPDVATELTGIPFSGVAVLTLGYPSSALKAARDGFGFLAPSGQGVRSLGVQFVSTTFPSHAPPGTVSFRAIAGGARDPSFLELDERQAVAAVMSDLEKTLGIRAGPIFIDYRRVPRAIPQYEVGYEARLARIQERLASLRGLHLTGNSYAGVGVNDCLSAARSLAQRLASEPVEGPVASV